MRVSIKDFNAGGLEIGSKGIEFDVKSPDRSTHRGDLVVTMRYLIWCKGKTTPAGGKKITWDKFIAWADLLP